MIDFKKDFGQLVAQERMAKGWTQERLAEAMGIEYSRLGKWERGVRKFPVEMLPLVTKVLQTTILFDEAGQIRIGEGVLSMNNLFTLDFETFNVAEALATFRADRQQTFEQLHHRAELAYEKCQAAGWTFVTEMNQYPLDEAYPTANHLDHGDSYQFYPTGQYWEDLPRLVATVSFHLSGDWFNLPRFIEDLTKAYGADLAHFVEKAFVYGCLKESKGSELFQWAYFKKDSEALTRIFPTLAPWASLVAEQAQSHDYVEKYEGLMPDYDWYLLLDLVDEYQDQEFMLSWETPDQEWIEVEDADSLRTFDDLIETALVVIEEEFEQVKANYEALLSE